MAKRKQVTAPKKQAKAYDNSKPRMIAMRRQTRDKRDYYELNYVVDNKWSLVEIDGHKVTLWPSEKGHLGVVLMQNTQRNAPVEFHNYAKQLIT